MFFPKSKTVLIFAVIALSFCRAQSSVLTSAQKHPNESKLGSIPAVRLEGQDRIEGFMLAVVGLIDYDISRDTPIVDLLELYNQLQFSIDKEELQLVRVFLETCWTQRNTNYDGVTGDMIIDLLTTQITNLCELPDFVEDEIDSDAETVLSLDSVESWGGQVNGACKERYEACRSSRSTPGRFVSNRDRYFKCRECQTTCVKNRFNGRDWVYSSMVCGAIAVPKRL